MSEKSNGSSRSVSVALRTVVISATVASAVATGACQLEKLFPDRVADGVARLTARNTAILVSVLNADAECGFSSPYVLGSGEVDGEIGDIGSITYTVSNCKIEMGALSEISEDCNGEKTSVSGTMTIDATRKVTGYLTGNVDTPVIPNSSESAQIHIDAEVENYEVVRTDSPNSLLVKSGSFSYDVVPHLARSESLEVCSVATSNLTLSNIQYGPSVVEVKSPDSNFETEIDSSVLNIQIGLWQSKENYLEGKLSVWGSEHDVPIESEFPGLDPEYDAERFRGGYVCNDDLKTPIDYTCPNLTPPLAEGASRLTVSIGGTVATLLDKNTECGFSSPQVINNAQLIGPLGYDGGQVRYEVTEPCRIEFPIPTVVAENCTGKQTIVEGTVFMTGVKTIAGIRSGDINEPIVPTSRFPALLVWEGQFEDFRQSDNVGANALTIFYGNLSGVTQPQTVKDLESGACSKATPIATLTNIELRDAKLGLENDGRQFNLTVPIASYEGQNGKRGERENYLSGTITTDNQTITVPLDETNILDPEYTPESFLEAWNCGGDYELVTDDSQCTVLPMVAEGAASLIVAIAGSIASKVNASSDCGFADTFGVLIDPWQVVGDVGEMGSITWKVSDCLVGSQERTLHSEGCTGGRQYTEGTGLVDATRVVTGERNNAFELFGLGIGDSIIPNTRESVTIYLDNVDLSGYGLELFGAGQVSPTGKLVLDGGTITGIFAPVMGERADEPGAYDIATPAAVVTDLRLEDAQGTVESDGKTFKVYFEEVYLNATNGTWGGASNVVEGWMDVDGQYLPIGPIPLDPGFDQAGFDASYECLENLAGIVPT